MGSVTAGNVGTGEDEEDAFPGESIDQIRQHLVTDLPVYKPDVILLQLDVANDLDKGVTATQEASELQALLNQIYYILPNTTVLLGDPTPSVNAATQSAIYTGSGSYISQSNQIVADMALAGHRIQAVPLDFEDDTGDLDTTAPADGVPNYNGYVDMASVYATALLNLEQARTIVDQDAVVVNPSSIIEDGSGIDDTGEGGSLSGGPCDIYDYYGTPCAAAYSMTRSLYANYDGPLYQVTRADGTTDDVGPLTPGGVVNAPAQDSFCAGTTCTVTKIYDQSPDANNLTIEGGGGANHSADQGAIANALPVRIGGNEAYGADIEPGTGYRDDTTTEIATKGAPEGMYMVASGTHVNSGCCFDFGNVETNNNDNNAGHMDAVNLTTWCGGNSSPCAGDGPWVEADLENGQWMGNGPNPNDTGNDSNYVTAMLKNNGQDAFELQGGDSTSGGLTKWYDGALPSGYQPMHQEGAIVMGTGGDNSNADIGSFFEGVLTTGFPSDAADAAVQANIVAAGYAGSTNPAGFTSPVPGGAAASAAGEGLVHQGYSSVFTVDPVNGHLHETYLPKMFDSWQTHDLSSTASGDLPGTPPVMAGTQPVALLHCGYTSVFTVDENGDLQETYLSAIGQSWKTHDLSALYGTPPTNVTPTAVVHAAGAPGSPPAACGYTSVYTRDRNGDLEESYLPAVGQGWTKQDLSANYQAPQIQPGTSPVAVVHCGYTSVFTVDAVGHQLQETYLPAIGQAWKTQPLNAPPTATTPTAVVHLAGAAGASGDCGYTSVFTVDEGSQHLQETYLPNAGFPGDPWLTHDLSSTAPTMAGTPPVAPGTQPEALVHLGYTSVYTVDEGSQHVEETYLPAIGDSWTAQDLTTNYKAPVTDQSPVVLLHPDAGGSLGYVSVFTAGEFSDDLEETYLPDTGFPGDPWLTQDLSTGYTVPPVAVTNSANQASWTVAHGGYTSAYTVDWPANGASGGTLQETYLPQMFGTWSTKPLPAPGVSVFTRPVALVHDGYASVYTVDSGDSSHAAGDLQETYLPAIGGSWSTQDLSKQTGAPPIAAGSSPAAVFHDGYTSIYTVDTNGDLEETFLPALGGSWKSQDLTQVYQAPKVLAGTSPVAIYHDGYTSVFTVDAGNPNGSGGDLQETFLPVMGGGWSTHDLTQMTSGQQVEAGTSPTVVFHDGYVSVYTADASYPNDTYGDLRETYLPAIGDNWVTQDLTSKYNLPGVIYGATPAALYHTGFTSVYFSDWSTGGLDEAYLPAISDAWGWNGLSKSPPGAPTPDQSLISPLLHYAPNDGLTWTSVFTIDSGSNDLQETYLPAIGGTWSSQDLSTESPPGTPPW
ncbi:MAG TPA: arabinofuranosidase catalytic domain-containing protein [Trebonia sp.]|nr:arabinofuranosidase catalytic domain-containing protein [Trebonia sp.]